MQEEAVRRSGDDEFGLHMGNYAEPGSYSIVGYLMMNCETLGQAFLKVARYYRIIGTLITLSAKMGFKTFRLDFHASPKAPDMSRHCFEAIFASAVRLLKSLTGEAICPVQINLTWPRPECASEYEEFFHCPVYFDKERNSMTLETRIIKFPVLCPNPQLREYFEGYAREYLADLDELRNVAHQVVERILGQLDEESPSIRAIASEMSMSVRTLIHRSSEWTNRETIGPYRFRSIRPERGYGLSWL